MNTASTMGFCLPNFCAELDFMGGARSEQNTLNAASARAIQPILNVVNLRKYIRKEVLVSYFI